ncbi:HPF/RaiA family ribosome-associated protein [Salibacter halophilus]|uniref:HPF/RaiA family ribosome-associated protein n=1 Tax=Salibacter halophilus TaxID=1803916 RepID=A0A6N6MDW2_9FLAO|nr:HPF/RaiA family ribosome-associated protein [Salibacter halophilus]KAB1065905.1 HPF/RaiA family ribosome-associated protein [Salibacter halophilus]
MKIQLNTDKNIQGSEALEKGVSEKINHELKHFDDRITRVEVHLSDVNADKGGENDIQCKIEARVEGMKPMFVESKNSSKEVALDEAVDKMKATLKSALGKMRDQ